MKNTNIYRFTSIGRPMDFDNTSNIVIVLVSVILLAGGFIYQIVSGKGWQNGILWGLGISVSVFLAWALSRETEPGIDLPAYISALVTTVLILYFYPPNFPGLIWLMLTLRIVNRSTGQMAKWSDSLLITFFTFLLIFIGYPQYALFGAVAFLLDGVLLNPDKKQIGFAVTHIVIFLVTHFYNDTELIFHAPSVRFLIPIV
ncbi:MAG: hypothetical protein KDC05_16590, partial [Bacteroidales bacterium]|nr:hypothetical protein [Bacteroidales bacterium]